MIKIETRTKNICKIFKNVEKILSIIDTENFSHFKILKYWKDYQKKLSRIWTIIFSYIFVKILERILLKS